MAILLPKISQQTVTSAFDAAINIAGREPQAYTHWVYRISCYSQLLEKEKLSGKKVTQIVWITNRSTEE